MSLGSRLQAILPTPAYQRLSRLKKGALVWLHRNDLSRLAWLFGTDKWGSHWYTQHYERYFAPIKKKALNVLEIGVGGYDLTEKGGASLRMWKAYFRRSRIVGIDLYDKSRHSEYRIDIRQCDQTDSEALLRLSKEYGGFDIIIDDGSHINEHVIGTFNLLFPLLRQNGIYVVEDTQTAYWPSWGGGMGVRHSLTAFFKGLTDGLNHVEYPLANYTPNYFDQNIVEIAFFHNLIVIRKGNNDEKSNARHLIERELTGAQVSPPQLVP
jgi:hypothetical protein